jgi:hypothetical protein
MELERQLLDIERRLWTNDAAFYHDNLVENALLIFPETGVCSTCRCGRILRRFANSFIEAHTLA